MRLCLKLTAVFVVLVGVLLIDSPFNHFFWRLIDRGHIRGLSPVLHRGDPWGFSVEDIEDLAGQVAIVTGANAGLGFWTSHHLAANGAHVIMACRSKAKCQAAKDKILATSPAADVEVMVLDLGSLKSVHSFAAGFKAAHQRLDSLVLNAGIMAIPFGLTQDGIERQMGVNHFGHFYLTQRLEELLVHTATASSPTTITVVSSTAHYWSYSEGIKLTLEELNNHQSYREDLAYGQSKLANVLFAQELAQRLQGSHVLVNAVHPGGVDTEITRSVFEENKFLKTLPSYCRKAILSFLNFAKALATWTPEDASLTQVYTAVSTSLKQQKITGKYFHPIARQHPPCQTHATNATLQTRFWQMSETIITAKTEGF